MVSSDMFPVRSSRRTEAWANGKAEIVPSVKETNRECTRNRAPTHPCDLAGLRSNDASRTSSSAAEHCHIDKLYLTSDIWKLVVFSGRLNTYAENEQTSRDGTRFPDWPVLSSQSEGGRCVGLGRTVRNLHRL